MDKPKKVIFTSSSGGHLTELLKLNKLFFEYEYLLVTEKTDITENVTKEYNTEFLKYGSRRYFFKYMYIFTYNFFKCINIILKFKPHTIVSTGAHSAGILCFVAKMFGAKIIYIESLANIKKLSVTGRNVYMFADKFYVQWKTLANKYKKAIYLGRLS